MPYPVASVRNKNFGISASALLTSLVSYWKIDETSGVRNDSYGTNHLTDNNTVTYNPGVVSNAGQFTAANNETLSIANNATLSVQGLDFTISLWTYLDSMPTLNSNRYLIGKNVGNTDYSIYLNMTAGGTERFAFLMGNTASGSPTLLANTFGTPSNSVWYHVLCEYNTSTKKMKIIINNTYSDEGNNINGSTTGSGTFRVGGVSGGGSVWDGRIDEIGFWKRLLTDSEKSALYNNGAGLTYPFS